MDQVGALSHRTGKSFGCGESSSLPKKWKVLLMTSKGIIVRQAVREISQQGRATTGVQLQKLDADDYVASVAVISEGMLEEDALGDEPDEPGPAGSTSAALSRRGNH